MNYLKAGLRIKLNLTNPYQIKPDYKLFNQSSQPVKARIEGIVKANYDSKIVRFKFDDQNNQNKCLGLSLGQFVWLNIKGERRPYVPISAIDEPGGVQFFIRDLTEKNQKSFCKKIFNLEPSELIDIQGPGTQFIYKGYGKMIHGNFKPVYSTSDSSSKQPVEKTYKNIGIITHASGITTTYALLESILMNFDNRTGISLLWLGDTAEDFVFMRELTAFAEQGKLNLNLMLTKHQKGWLGPYGRVTKSHLQEFMPMPSEDTMIIMSALEGQNTEIKELVRNMYPNYVYA